MSDRDDSGLPVEEPPTPRQKPSEPKSRLPVRFYKGVSLERAGGSGGIGKDSWRVLLDGRPVKTPKRKELAVANHRLCQAIASEWEAQEKHIDPSTMPFTKMVNTALDGICGRELEVGAALAEFIESDAICYRASEPSDLVAAQGRAWDPLVAWAGDELGLELVVTSGVMPVVQADATLPVTLAAMTEFDALELGAIHVLATLTGSLVIALALSRGRLSAREAWECGHVDEDYQVAKWGEDEEASARRAVRRSEFDGASRFLALLK